MNRVKTEIPKSSSAALRALREAAERRMSDSKHSANNACIEINGQKGPDPTRYGDWEKNGIASDF